jgi:hypothetical protein
VSQAKVVELSIDRGKKASLPPILHTVRQQAKKEINELLQGLFNNTDDALFELADRSRSDQDQHLYFDSMRRIRLHRKSMASLFVKQFYDGFDRVFVEPAASTEPELDEVSDDEFSLLQNDELELSVAISGIVSKITSQYSLPIMQLTKRMDSLAKDRTVTERLNPLGPQAVSEAFVNALAELDVDIKIRIILLKLFERFVMERLGTVFEHSNELLVQAGVLPDLKVRRENRSSAPRREPLKGDAKTPMASAELPVGGNVVRQPFAFNTIQTLLRGAGDLVDHGTGGGGSERGFDTGAGVLSDLPALATPDVVTVLSAIQSEARVTSIDASQVPVLADLRSLVLAKTAESGEQKSLGQSDDDTVNFVGMLFDYILNDRNLAIPMKALIGRLQIPIVKLAVIDKTFFEKTSHPARALLNELSSAGIGWSSAHELKRDSLYDKIESVVLRVLNEFNDNPDIFTPLLRDLREFVGKDTKRSVLVEQRVKESESGKAQTQDAKLQVQRLVNQKACGLRLPQEVGRFISETWSRVLVLRIVKHTKQSEAWIQGIQTLDDLLWMLQPLPDIVDIEARDVKTGPLLQAIRTEMADVNCAESEIVEFGDWLQNHLAALSANDRAYLEEDAKPEVDVPMEVVEEVVLTSVEPHDEARDDSLEPEFAERLKALTEGTWVDVQTERQQLRCKLATITQPGNNYVFVNRRGMKVLEKRRMDLAVLFKEDKISLIDESQVFDRALQSVVGNLRRLQRSQS